MNMRLPLRPRSNPAPGRLRIAGALAAAVLLATGCGSENAADTAPTTTADPDVEASTDSSPPPSTTVDAEPTLEPEPTVEPEPTTDPAPTTTIPRGLLPEQTTLIDGLERRYRLYLPDDTNGAPIVVLLHQNTSSATQLLGLDNEPAPYGQWFEIADRDGVIVAAPEGIGGAWNDCRADAGSNSDADDVGFVTSLIDDLAAEFNADRERVFVMGTSNGGHLALRLAEEAPDDITAFAAVAAANAGNSECAPGSEAVPAMFVNGTADPIMPFDGGEMFGGTQIASSMETVDYWAARNGIDSAAETTTFEDIDPGDGSTIVESRWGDGTGSAVVLYTVDGGGHTEPSVVHREDESLAGLFGTQNGDVEVAEIAWDFFVASAPAP